jgi:TonB-linked SusC/RagA family outer membrane protein
MKRILLCLTAVFALVTSELWAQERTVSGKVTSVEDGSPLPGVNILLKGTTTGVVTDADGKYTMNVPTEGGTLVFTFIGLKTQEVEIGSRTSIDVQIEQDSKQLTEVVVTALGVQRDVKSLPYAAQTVSSEKLSITRPNNINDALAGKVAGVQLRGQSGAALGRNSAIRIRGAGSLNDKAPLYVVDGTPTNSLDLNPDDIESVNVLKGPSATALYGQRGDAGVIIVTSKKGTKSTGLGVNVNHTTTFDKVYVLPRYQNSYAGGSFSDLAKFTWQEGMPEEWKGLDGKFYHDYIDDASWGPRMVGQEYIPWYAWAPGTKYTGKTASLVPQPDNIRDFYETGVNKMTNVSFSQAIDESNFRLSYTNQAQTGIMPNTDLQKNTLATQFSVKLSKIITVGANINYVNQRLNGEFDDAYSNATTGAFNQWFHRNLDMDIMKELAFLKSPEGRLVSWNHFNPNEYLTSGDKFYRGYYWFGPTTYMNLIDNKANRDRLFGDVNVSFNLAKNLKLTGFYRKNQVTTNAEFKRPTILPYSFNTELRPTNQPQWDFYGTGNDFSKEDNLELIATYNKSVLEDKLSIDLMAGGNIRKETYNGVFGSTFDGLVVPDLFTLGNSRKQPFSASNFRSKKEVRSIYGRANLGYRDLIYVDMTLRNDWSSALPASNNSYMYPSVGTSFVFSELTENALPVVSFGKLRASWAQVGSDLGPYQLATTYGVGADQWKSDPSASTGSILMSAPNEIVDPNIQPSLSSSYEVGADLKFFQNKIGFSATYFTEVKKNEILSVGVSGASGFTAKRINAGELQRSSLEFQLEVTPVQTADLEWNVSVNYAKNTSKIVELAPDVTAIPEGSGASFGLADVYHVAGQNWGQLRGKTYQTIDGQRVLDSKGFYVPTENPEYLGSVLPDFSGGIVNTVSYKDFSLAMNIDFQKGGQFFSLSDFWGSFSGLTQKTAGLNDKGNPIRDNPADGGGVHVTGVDKDGTAVDFYVPAQDYYHQFNNSKIADEFIHDLTFVKLRELSLGYRIPVKSLGSIGSVFTSASVSIVGRNLWLMHTNVRDFDPAEISGTFGENGQFPSTRSIGFNIKFGF